MSDNFFTDNHAGEAAGGMLVPTYNTGRLQDGKGDLKKKKILTIWMREFFKKDISRKGHYEMRRNNYRYLAYRPPGAEIRITFYKYQQSSTYLCTEQ